MAGNSPTTLPAGRRTAVPLLVGLLVFVLFIPDLFNAFVDYDDYRFVVNNPDIRRLSLEMVGAALTQPFTNDYWTPLTWISFALDYHFWGLNPFGYHLENNLFHAVNTALVVLIADLVWQRTGAVAAGDGSPGWARQPGWLYPWMLLGVGLFWGGHPLRVESVAWVAERKDVLYGMLALGSIYCHLRHGMQSALPARATGWMWYLLSLLFFMLATLAKPTSVFVPLLLVVADWYPLGRWHQGECWRALVEKIPYFVLAALATLLVVKAMSLTSPIYSYRQFPFGQRLLVAGYSVFAYCRLHFWPTGIHIFNSLAFVFAQPLAATVKTAFVAAVTAAVCLLGRRRPWAAAVWFAFLLPLLPTLAFFQVGVDVSYSTRHTYLASVAPSILLATLIGRGARWAVLRGDRRRQLLLAGMVTAFLVFCAAMTVHLFGQWRNAGTLWSRVIELQPIGRAYSNRARYYLETGEYRRAAEDYLVAATRAEEAGNPEAFNYFALAGDAFGRAGLYREAVAAFGKAIERQPLPIYHYHRGLAYRQLGDGAAAAADFRMAGAARGEIEFYPVP